MKRSILASAIVACCVAAGALGQAANTPARPTQAPVKPVVTSQTAITKDGRTVILKSDGTWVYGADPAPTQSPVPVAATGTLTAQVAVVMQSGDVKPIARREFVVLKKSAVDIAKEQGLQPTGSNLAFTLSIELNVWSQQPEAMRRISAEILKNVIMKAETDFGGKLEIKGLPLGSYYLFGFTSIGKSSILWDLPITIKPGANSITLDQHNAASAI